MKFYKLNLTIAFFSIIFTLISCNHLKSNSSGQDKIPKSVGFVNDFENIFTPEEIRSLDSLSTAIEKESTIEIAVVTLDSSLILNNNFDSTVLLIGQKWGVGKKDTNNGIVIGISKSMRKIRICNGYGIEKKLSNDQTKEIMNSVLIPQLRAGEYFVGVRDVIIVLYKMVK
jgi:uncharacterized protein